MVERGEGRGAWLPWADVEAVCRLGLRPPSLWPVFLAALLTSRRYGGGDARLGASDLAKMTGLGRRTVQAALGKLIRAKLIARVGPRGVLRVTLPTADDGGAAGEGKGAGLSAPSGASGTPARRADEPAPRRRKLVCASPTSIHVSPLGDEVGGAGAFTPRQRRVIADVLAEATELLGEDARGLPLTAAGAAKLGLPPGATFGEALRSVAAAEPGAARVAARDVTKLVLGLRKDERVQGVDL